MLRSAEIERAREARYQEPNVDDATPPEGPCLAGRDSKSGEPIFHAWRFVDGQLTSCSMFADAMTPDEVEALPADERSVALEWRARIEAMANARDPEFAVHNAEPRDETMAECRGDAA
jgi:hypothetical protein